VLIGGAIMNAINRPSLHIALLKPLETEWVWQLAALCRTADPELFFPSDRERGQARLRRQRRAKQICAQCLPYRVLSAIDENWSRL